MCTGFAPTNFSTAARKWSVSPESAATKSCVCEACPRGSSSTSRFSTSARRASAVTFAPSFASSTAHARPMPCDAPQTNAWRPVKSRSILFSRRFRKGNRLASFRDDLRLHAGRNRNRRFCNVRRRKDTRSRTPLRLRLHDCKRERHGWREYSDEQRIKGARDNECHVELLRLLSIL